jgi:hypothetical protein
MFYEPVADNRKLAKLINNDALPDAVGYYSGHNTLHATVIGKNDVTQQDSTAAALKLKAAIDRTLTPGEKAALKQRIDFVVEQAQANVAKLGMASTRPEDANDQDKMWMKSIAVSFPTFLGTDKSVLEAIGGQASEAGIKSRDFITALAIHRDTIFG